MLSLMMPLTRVDSPTESGTAAVWHLGQREHSQQHVPQQFQVQPPKGVKLFENAVEELQRCSADRRFTSVDLVEFCLQRIHPVCATFLSSSISNVGRILMALLD